MSLYANAYARTCQTMIAPVARCVGAIVGRDERGEVACRHHATYLFNTDGRPQPEDTPTRAWARALFAAHDAFALYPELRG